MISNSYAHAASIFLLEFHFMKTGSLYNELLKKEQNIHVLLSAFRPRASIDEEHFLHCFINFVYLNEPLVQLSQ